MFSKIVFLSLAFFALVLGALISSHELTYVSSVPSAEGRFYCMLLTNKQTTKTKNYLTFTNNRLTHLIDKNYSDSNKKKTVFNIFPLTSLPQIKKKKDVFS